MLQFRGDPSGTGRWDPHDRLPAGSGFGGAAAREKILTWSAYSPTASGSERLHQDGDTRTSPPERSARRRSTPATTCSARAPPCCRRPAPRQRRQQQRQDQHLQPCTAWSAGPLVRRRAATRRSQRSTGRVFTIGGSWSGGTGGKNGEVWSATAGDDAVRRTGEPILTDDPGGVYRADNQSGCSPGPTAVSSRPVRAGR